jgi:MFS transporter, YNFM family, putative membrane transport protein
VRTFGVVVAGFCAFLQLYSTQPLLPTLTQVFSASPVEVSLTITLASLGVALGAPIAGLLADRLGRRRIIVWSAFLVAGCTLAAATSPNLPTLLFWRFCQGLCTPGVFSVTVAYINDEWSGAEIGRALSAYVSGTVLGGFSCRFIAGMVASHFEWRWVFVVLGVLNLAGAITVAALLQTERRGSGRDDHESFASAVAGHFRNRRLMAVYIVGFCVLFSLVATFTYVTFYLAAPPFHLEPAALGSIFFVYLVGAAVNPLAGRAIGRFGPRTVLVWAIGGGVAGVALTLIQSLWAVGLGLTICSSGVFAAQTASNGQVGLAARRNRALAAGLYATFYYLGGGLGASVPGYFWNWGGWPACVAFIAVVQVVTVLLALKLWEQRVAQSEQPGFINAPEMD